MEIVVLGMNYSTPLGVIRSLGEAGYLVNAVIINSNKKECNILGSSKYVKHLHIQAHKDDRLLVNYLKETYKDNKLKILLPTDDYTTAVIDKYKGEFDSSFKFPHIGPAGRYTINQLMDKEVQGELIKGVGLAGAKAVALDLNSFKAEELEDLSYPCFVKPLQSFKGQKKELLACADKEQLLKKLQSFKAKSADRKVLVQQLLEIEKEYTLSGICWGSQVVMAPLIKKLRVSQSHKGLTLCGEFVEWKGLEAVKPKLECFLRSLDYHGMFGLELFLLKNGEIFYNELNLRTSGINYGVTKNGMNQPVILLEALVKGELNYDEKLLREQSLGKHFFNDRVAWDEVITGNMTKQELRQYESEADYFLLTHNEDYKPEKLFESYIERKKRKYFLKRLARKLDVFGLFQKE